MHLVHAYILSINVVFNYNKSSIILFIVYSFIYVIKQNACVIFIEDFEDVQG